MQNVVIWQIYFKYLFYLMEKNYISGIIGKIMRTLRVIL